MARQRGQATCMVDHLDRTHLDCDDKHLPRADPSFPRESDILRAAQAAQRSKRRRAAGIFHHPLVTHFLVPTLRERTSGRSAARMPSCWEPARPWSRAAERRKRHSHAERGNEEPTAYWPPKYHTHTPRSLLIRFSFDAGQPPAIVILALVTYT